MRRAADATIWVTPDPGARPRARRVVVAGLACAVLLAVGYVALHDWVSGPESVRAAEPAGGEPAAPVASPSTTSPSPTTIPAATAPPPAPGERYVVEPGESEPEAKQIAADVAYTLTNYDASDGWAGRLIGLGSRSGITRLTEAAEPLTYPGSWSRGTVIYPQLGGLTEDGVSVMVVTRQVVGTGPEPDLTVVRTLDIRLVLEETGWVFDGLASAGGSFGGLEDLALAHAVASDTRIDMPDSARLDILKGLVSPVLLDVMARLADRTPYAVSVLATGHPYNVYGTAKESLHTSGRAVDIYLIGGTRVVDDRDPASATHSIVEWLYENPDVLRIGSPWDLDGPGSPHSFTDPVHQDHIHISTVG